MKEDLHIKIAADLADTQGPEILSERKAAEFVSKTLGNKRKTIPFRVWCGATIAVAASVVLAVVLFSPEGGSNIPSPNQIMEKYSVHADMSQVDSTIVDTLETKIVIKEVVE